MRNAFEGLSTEAMQQMMLVLLAEIAEKLPRVDANDRVMTNGGDITQPVSLSTLATVTTVGTVTTSGTLQNLGAASRPADGIPMHLANAGAMHLYNNIIVS